MTDWRDELRAIMAGASVGDDGRIQHKTAPLGPHCVQTTKKGNPCPNRPIAVESGRSLCHLHAESGTFQQQNRDAARPKTAPRTTPFANPIRVVRQGNGDPNCPF